MPSSPQDTDISRGMDMSKATRGVLNSVAINAIPTLVLFVALKNLAHTSDVVALLVSGIPATLYGLVGIIRRRRIDFFSGFMLFVIVVGLVLLLVGGNPRFYLLRMSLISLSLGLAYMVSLLFPKPLWFYVGRYLLTGNDPQNIARFNSQWQYPYFRFAMRLMTAFWGTVTLVFTAIQVVLVIVLPISIFLLISPALDAGLWLLLLGWTGWYIRRMRKRLATLKENEPSQIQADMITS